MREILFRGKQKCDSKWTFGNLKIAKDGAGIEGYLGISAWTYCIQIDPDTVGQYTGLDDIDNRKIFDGDILEAHLDGEAPEAATHVLVEWGMFGWQLRDLYVICDPDPIDEFDIGRWKIIGNRWDNPELLNGGDE